MSIYLGLAHGHSVLRWVVMLFLLYSIAASAWTWKSSGVFSKTDSLAAGLTAGLTHLQLLLGFILYFMSPKVMFMSGVMANPVTRFFTVEHIAMMLPAIACVTIGNIKSQKLAENSQKAKPIFLWFAAALVLIVAAIPWPFRDLGSPWL